MTTVHSNGPRIRGAAFNVPTGSRRPHSRNRQWNAADAASRSDTSSPNHGDGERWERGGGRGGPRGRGRGRGVRVFPNQTLRNNATTKPMETVETDASDVQTDVEEEMGDIQDDFNDERDASDFEFPEIHEPELETPEERERFYQELVKAREVERKKAIAEGKMDDPLVPKRLEDAITMVGTCLDMCPRFERYRRERENNLFEWETIPGTKRINHTRAVKMYERAAGDKTLPSDLRPPKVLEKTLDYLFHDLLPRGGFSQTHTFIRDRSRAVRNDFTMQHESGPIAIECHDRCARFHILALHLEKDKKGFSVALEEQQLMNTLQSLKEFYEEQRGRYESPTELEMRVYHRLIHIRDQRERHEEIPGHITSHPVFKLTTEFRLHVQKRSAPISKTSALLVDAEGMQIFGQLASVLREQGSVVMIYLVACILERLFGKDTIEDIESIRGELSLSDIIDGRTVYPVGGDLEMDGMEAEEEGFEVSELEEQPLEEVLPPQSLPPTSVFGAPTGQTSFFGIKPSQPAPSGSTSVFASLANASSAVTNIFGGGTFGATTSSQPTSIFGSAFSSAPKPVGSATGVEKSQTLQPTFGTSATAPTLGGSTGPNQQPALKSLNDAAPLRDSANETLPPQLPPSSFFAGSGFGAGPFQPQINGTSNPLLPQPPAPSPFFGTPPAPSFSKPEPQPESNNKIPSFFGAASSPPKPSLNPAAPASTPLFGGQPQTHAATAATTTPTLPNVAGAINSTASPVPNAPSSVSNGTPSAFSIHTAPKLQSRKSSTPPLRINTGVSTPPSTVPPFPIPIPPTPTPGPLRSEPTIILDSPKAPPPLKKHEPISLPPTPSASMTIPNPILGSFRSNMASPITPQASGIVSGVLSPLEMPSTPSGSNSTFVNNFSSPRRGPLSRAGSSLLSSTLLKKDKGKGLEVPESITSLRPTAFISAPTSTSKGTVRVESEEPETNAVPTREELEAQARTFEEKIIIAKVWTRWKRKLADIKAWAEAVDHSDAYRAKLKSRKSLQLPKEQRAGAPEKRRRVPSGEPGSLVEKRKDGSPSKKRQRKKRISDYQEPRTDEEIAKRFKENQEENKQLWAQGSYLNVIRTHVHSRMKMRKSWNVWLSLNSESDSSAIWLERKFNVPTSGRWASETVFEIPLFPDLDASRVNEDKVEKNGKEKGKAKEDRNTGLIVFECTPTDHIQDDIERKYYVLDDCSRLRDTIDMLSPRRHYLPSLLILTWGTGDQSQQGASTDLLNVVKKYVDGSILAGYATLGLTATTNLDSVLERVLQTLKLDVEGRLVKTLTIQGAFRTFEEDFSQFLIEWLDNCSANGYFDWYLYGHLVQAAVVMLNKMGALISAVLSRQKQELLQNLDITPIRNSDTAYEAAFTWLSHINNDGDTEAITMDLQSHMNIGQEFPARTFIQHLLGLMVHRTEKHTDMKPQEKQYIPAIDLKAASELFEASMQPLQTSLSLALNMSVRRSPKRREKSEETEGVSPEAKRLKMTPSVTSTAADASPPATPRLNGRGHSPSPSIVSVATETPGPASNPPSISGSPQAKVTVAMLRALTRDVKRKYASPAKGVPSTPFS